MRIGPVSGTFSGKLTVANEVPPESCTLIVEGKGAAGFAKGDRQCEFIEEKGPIRPCSSTQASSNIGGKLAGIGQRLIDSVGKSMINQGL